MGNKINSNVQELFLKLVCAGLWENDVHLSAYGETDWGIVLQLAEEQSVVGLVAAGLEKVKDVTVLKEVVLQFVGSTLQIEQRNKEMNEFVAKLTKRLRSSDVYSLVVKGQGLARCYEKPLWRACGDVDLLLNEENYEKAKKVLFPIAYDIQDENKRTMHQALQIMGIEVELHGKMPFSVSRKAQQVNDEIVSDSVNNGGVSAWRVNDIDVFIPNADNHVFLVFTHLLQHFFIEGVGLRQICDWCRMLWKYRDSLNYNLLEERVCKAGLKTEWQAFASLAVDSLGMPISAMPLYDSKFKAKGKRIMKRVMKSGNFGHNNDLSYRSRYKGLTYKVVATWRRFWDFASLVPVFPLDAPRFFVGYLRNKV